MGKWLNEAAACEGDARGHDRDHDHVDVMERDPHLLLAVLLPEPRLDVHPSLGLDIALRIQAPLDRLQSRRAGVSHPLRYVFTICLCVGADVDGYRAPKMKQ